MKRWIGLGAIVAIAALTVGLGTRDRAAAPAREDAHARVAATETRAAPGRHGSSPPPIRAPIHLTRLDPGERDEVAKRIADARAARAARGVPSGAPIPDHVDQLDLEHAPADLVDALQASIPILAECYRADADARPSDAPVVLMTLEGDPDVGTLVDPGQITDGDGKPLDPRVAECLRSTLSSLELPPLRQGQELQIQYTFRF